MPRRKALALALAALAAGAPAAAAPPPDAVDEALAAFPERFKAAIDDATRAVAVAELGLLRDPRVAAALKEHLQHPSPEVRIAVARTLGEQRDPAVAPVLAALFAKEEDRKPPDAPFLAALLEGIGEADAKRQYRLLKKAAWKWLELDLSVCRAAAQSMARAKTAEAVGDLVDLVEKADSRRLDQNSDAWKKAFEDTVDAIVRELARVTGRDIKNVKDWRDWWRENRRTWTPPSALDEGKPKDADLFADPAGKFTVRRPSASWTWTESKVFVVRAVMRVEGAVVADFAIKAESTSALQAQTASAMAAEWKPKIEGAVTDVKADRTRWSVKTKFAGETAYVHEVFGRHEDWGVGTLRWFLFVHDGVSYRVMGRCNAAREEPAWKEFEAFFASFRWAGR